MKDINFETKKILLAGINASATPLSLAIVPLLQDYVNLYEISTDSHYLQTAAEFIQAYLDLGLSYLEHRQLFDQVLEQAGYSAQQITLLRRKNPVLPLNKSRVRAVLGKWAASIHNSHTIVEVVDDIISRVNDCTQGTASYFTAKKDGTYTALFHLTVSQDYALLHDVFRNKFYQLEKKVTDTMNKPSSH